MNALPDNPTEANLREAVLACEDRLLARERQEAAKLTEYLRAKAVNFARLYGMEETRLSEEMMMRAGLRGRREQAVVYDDP